ncbi:unnamed protein product [Diatraea saccharalis]|uniref:Retinol dehydrogenase 12 n=1 Tax=Diatraea saccharalis TaxID=40085 RepID=A0A9N9N1S0_9NEOP|nr:unnamed protein product [Diatraea saccharalis]
MDCISGWCKSERRLDGSVAIVTGSNTGIGKETASDFFNRGARVSIACRDIEKGNAAKKDIEKTITDSGRGELVVEKLDVASLNSVREFAKRILLREKSIDILVNNAGVMMCVEGKTEDGFETHIGTNHLGHALLTVLLLPKMNSSGDSRIVFVSSLLHKWAPQLDLEDMNFEKSPYDAYQAYCRSKAANVLFARALANELRKRGITNVTTYSLHPGVVGTDIGRHFSDSVVRGASWIFNKASPLFAKSPKCGAQTSIYCAVDEACSKESGLYYADCAVAKTSKQCQDDAFAAKFWDWTIESLKIEKYDPFQTSN